MYHLAHLVCFRHPLGVHANTRRIPAEFVEGGQQLSSFHNSIIDTTHKMGATTEDLRTDLRKSSCMESPGWWGLQGGVEPRANGWLDGPLLPPRPEGAHPAIKRDRQDCQLRLTLCQR